MLDPLGPVTIRAKDFLALTPWFWRFWQTCKLNKVEEIAAAQALLMHRVLDDFDEILEATGSGHLKQSTGAIHVYDTEKEYLTEKWQFDLSSRLGFEYHRLSSTDLKSMVPGLKLEKGVARYVQDFLLKDDPYL